jgi:hypothetical protein
LSAANTCGSVAHLRRVLQALRVHDGLQVEQRRLEQGVDYNEVEVPGLGHLDAGVGHALAITSAPSSPRRCRRCAVRPSSAAG